MLSILIGIMKTIRGVSKEKEALFHYFKNSTNSLLAIEEAQKTGKITPIQAKSKADLVKVGSRIFKAIPGINPETGKPLTHMESVRWVSKKLADISSEAKKRKIPVEELSDFFNKKVDDLQGNNNSLS